MKIAEGIATVANFLSSEECAQFIEMSEAQGFEEATVSIPGNPVMMKRVRNNDRVNLDSPELAESLWPRIAPHVAEAYPFQRAKALDSRFRFYRYDLGQRFKRHVDGSVEVGELTSKVTFMVYLNDDCQGGETIFREKDAAVGGEYEYRIKPESGMALLFEHRLWHEGAEVIEGRKYVMRSDILYDAKPSNCSMLM